MPNNPLTPVELRLLAELLELASDTFGNHGCNDFDLEKSVPSLEDRRKLMKAFNDHNGSPEDFEHDEENGDQYLMFRDDLLMGYLAHRVREQIEPDRKVILDADLDYARAHEQACEDYYGDE